MRPFSCFVVNSFRGFLIWKGVFNKGKVKPFKIFASNDKFPIVLSLWLTQLTYSTKKNQRCQRVYSSYVRNMPIRSELPKNPSLEQFWTSKTAKAYKTNLNRYCWTDFIGFKVKKFSEKKKLEIVANFGNLQIGLQRRLMCQFIEKSKKIEVSQICKFSNFTK